MATVCEGWRRVTIPVPSEDSPPVLQVTVTLPSYAAYAAFVDWLNSGDCGRAFWHWLGYKGRFI